METKNLLFAAALAGFALGGSQVFGAEAGAKKEPAPSDTVQGECHGINACKGQGECNGKTHTCAGQNECKGKGWVTMSEKACKEKKGTFKKN